jgi:seryl-tRNA synthetase
MGKFTKLIFVSTAIALSSSAVYAADNAEMVKSIMKLRADVEGLYTQIDENKDNYKSQMKSYAMQIADNEVQVNRKTTAIKVANAEILKLQEQIAEKGATANDLTPMLEVAIDNLEKIIITGIPFKVDERVADITKIKSDLKSKNITQEKALSLVWASYDDALRLTKEIGLFKQHVQIGDTQKLAKVAKIGTAMMFFLTPDDQAGYVKNNNGSYAYVVVEDSKSKEQIHTLFDALQKQIRTGYFNLPNALMIAGVK